MKIIRWFLGLFKRKNQLFISGPKIEVLETGSIAITESVQKKYLDDYALCIRSRMNEYPSWEDVIHALIEERAGDKSPMLAILRKRSLVKAKYKKPKKFRGYYGE